MVLLGAQKRKQKKLKYLSNANCEYNADRDVNSKWYFDEVRKKKCQLVGGLMVFYNVGKSVAGCVHGLVLSRMWNSVQRT